MENPISITLLNDFIFCPVSIYFHSLEYDTETTLYQSEYQINGKYAHSNSDNGNYSDRRDIFQGTTVYCEKYNLIGKIDTFDAKNGILTERKKKIKRVYDGYVFQLYSQYFSLIEAGYSVNNLRLYSMGDNKVYEIEKPEYNQEMLNKFEQLINKIETFDMNKFVQDNNEKCLNCIYEPLCSYSKKK